MTDLNRDSAQYLDCYLESTAMTATPLTQARGPTAIAALTGITLSGVTLAQNSTYYFPLGFSKAPVPAESLITSVQLRWTGPPTISACTITFETTLFPTLWQSGGTQGPIQLADWWPSTNPTGYWLQQNPSTAYVPIVGGTATAMTVTTTADGGCEFDIGNLGARRGRIKVVVGAGAGASMRAVVHGKGA